MLAHHFISRSLASSSVLSGLVEGRIFDWPNDEVISGEATVPYVIVKANGFTRQFGTKDDDFDSMSDIDVVLVTVVSKTDEDICQILQEVRRAVSVYVKYADWQDLGFTVEDYEVSGNGINFDELTGARSSVLTFKIENSKT